MPNDTQMTPLPERPIRFGILDSVSALVLFGVHLGTLKSILVARSRFGNELEPDRMAAAAVLCAAFAFGAAYLAFRYATSKKIATFRWRLLTLVLIDAGLVAIPLTLYLTRERAGGVISLMFIVALLVWTIVQSKLERDAQ